MKYSSCTLRSGFIWSSFGVWLLLLTCWLFSPTATRAAPIESLHYEHAGLHLELEASKESSMAFLNLTLPVNVKGLIREGETLFSIEKPGRVVIDLKGVQGVPTFDRSIGHPLIRALRGGNHPDKLRLVVDLNSDMAPGVSIAEVSGDTVSIQFGYKDMGSRSMAKAVTVAGERALWKERPSQQQRIPFLNRRAVETSRNILSASTGKVQGKKARSQVIRAAGESRPEDAEVEVSHDLLGDSLREYMRTLADEAEMARLSLGEERREKGTNSKDEESKSPFENMEGPPLELKDLLKRPDPPSGMFTNLKLLGVVAAVALLIFLFFRRYTRYMYVSSSVAAAVQDEQERSGLQHHYLVLGCRETDSDNDIKTRYKHLVKVFHTDRLTGQDLPDELMELSTEQFRRIQEAYEAIREERGLS